MAQGELQKAKSQILGSLRDRTTIIAAADVENEDFINEYEIDRLLQPSDEEDETMGDESATDEADSDESWSPDDV